MYHHYNDTFVWVFSDDKVFGVMFLIIFGLFGTMMGGIFGVFACQSYDKTPAAMRLGRVIGSTLTTALAVVGGYFTAKYGFVEAAFGFVFGWLCFVGYVWGAVDRRFAEVATALSVAAKLSASPQGMLSVLDYDRDLVVSRLDLENVKNRVLGSSLTEEEHSWLLSNTSVLGHRTESGNSTCVVSAGEFEAALKRVRELHRGWLPAE